MVLCETSATLTDPSHKCTIDLNYPSITARQFAWNGTTTQQVIQVITVAMPIYAIGV